MSRLRATVFGATLAVSMGMGPFAITAVSALSPSVLADLGLSRTDLGSLATISFLMGALSSALGGRQLEAFGARVALLWVFLTGGVATAVMAGAQTLPWLWIGAAAGGAGLGIANPVTNQLIADEIPPGKRAVQIGVKQSGVQMAQTLIGFTLPPLALLVGWRYSMLVGILVAIAGILLTWTVIPPSPGRAARLPGAASPPVDRGVWWLAAYTLLCAVATMSIGVYAPLYSFERVGLTAAVAGLTTGVVGAPGIVARILWARLTERSRSPARSLIAIPPIALLSVTCVMASEYAGSWLLWLGLVGFGASAIATNAVVMLVVVRDSGRTGQASAVVGSGMYLGFMTGPIVFGSIVDLTDSYTAGWLLTVLACLAMLVIAFVWRRHARVSAPARPQPR